MSESPRGKERWPGAVVFDLDGTLVDSATDITDSLNQLLAIKQLAPFSLSEVTDFIGDGLSVLIARAFSVRGWQADADELSTLLSMYRTVYSRRLTKRAKTYAGVVDLISRLNSDGIALGVCTNKDEDLAQGIIDGLGLRSCFAAVLGAVPHRARKPSPLPLLEILSRLGTNPQDAIMVGDGAADVECAKRAGVAFIGVTFGYSRTPITRLGARIVIDSYAEFDDACAALRGDDK